MAVPLSWVHIDASFMRYPYETQLDFEGISSETVKNILNGEFGKNLEGQLFEEILQSEQEKSSVEQSLKFAVEDKLKELEDLSRILEVLCLGISSLQLFVQNNWTGPADSNSNNQPLSFLRNNFSRGKVYSEDQWMEKLAEELVIDGETISPNIHNLDLLLVARAVLLASVFDGIESALWWRFRCLLIHQQVLEEHSPSLYNQLTNLVPQLTSSETVQSSSDLSIQLQLETARLWLYYGHVAKANEAVRAANKLLRMDVSLTGALGKRTKYQQKELAQLTLSVNVDRENGSGDVNTDRRLTMGDNTMPKDVKLEDDVRLNKISFSDTSLGDFPQLSPAEQATVLATCMYKKKSQPRDRLHTEEVLPYLTCLTGQPSVWALQMAALLYRSKLDSEHRRTVERALMQFQSLIDSVSTSELSAVNRLSWFYCSYLPPAWRLQALLANTYISLGMVQTALDEYLKLQLWEEVIACYNFLKLRHKAEEVIRQELGKKETVQLWCLLGDATDDVECYRHAWELSGERSGRAQRHWANYFFTRKQYAESIPHLEKSLSLNSLQVELWFRLGYAALIEENWELCATAYRRYCILEPESYEAWNNLAKAYVKLGQKARAFRALQEAVKCNYENWRVWDNLMAVSTDCGQFDEVIRCYHRILDLNEKHIDVEVLKILTNVVVKNLSDKIECPTVKLRKLSLVLFGRLTAQVLNNSMLWQLYAQLAASDEPSSENRAKVAQCLQKAYRAATQGSWERDLDNCQQVIDLCVSLAKAYTECSAQCGSSNEKVQLLSSAKLPLKSVLTKVEKEQTDLITGELPESLSLKHKALLSHYEQIIDEIQRLQSN